jgi:UDP-N-acetylmuramoyl-L-alanyl-D-glutamate--2,6-diaminopimelate ligase
MASLQSLLNGIVSEELIVYKQVDGLSLDSRTISQGDLFFAFPGVETDGRKFISQAIEKGAAVVLKEASNGHDMLEWRGDVPIVSIKGLAKKISHIASRFYNYPSSDMTVVGVTGTNGKTSCCYLLASALERLGKRSAIIGTLGYGKINDIVKQARTTPDQITFQSILNKLHNEDTEVVAVEVTSHAAMQDRVSGVEFDVGIFTNITHDHLDYHENFEEYIAAKRRFFEMPSLRYGVFNVDDPVGMQWMQEFSSKMHVCGYSLHSRDELSVKHDMVVAIEYEMTGHGIRAKITTPWGDGELQSSLLGKFNVSNLLSVIATLGLLGYSLDEILKIIPYLSTVPGRMQTISYEDKPLVVIDYAHTPDALEQSLNELRSHCEKELYCVFGCGGNRDSSKRPFMGSIAERLSDHVILTNDNVRKEKPEKIIDDIVKGFKNPNKAIIKFDRKEAILFALSKAQPGDVVLLAGKGHENYEIVGDQSFPFSEQAIVEEFFSNSK